MPREIANQLSLPSLGSPVKAPPRRYERREKLREILAGDLSFEGSVVRRGIHNTHAFAAKFPPELPRLFIDALTQRGELVLDPMVGSGTAVVEAAVAGRVGIGVDLDPLAVCISKVKSTPLETDRLLSILGEIIEKAKAAPNDPKTPWSKLAPSYESKVLDFFKYWFLPKTAKELASLVSEIVKVEDTATRLFLQAAFSATIVTKSGGVSLARDLAHSRPHKVGDKKIRDAINAFSDKGNSFLKGLLSLRDIGGRGWILRGDARALPIRGNSVSLIITSPPYANAIDYPRAHKFSLYWFGYAFKELSTLRRKYIGAEVREIPGALPSPTANSAIHLLCSKDATKAGILYRYFRDMLLCLGEMYRLLKIGRPAVIVVGPSQVRGIDVKTHEVIIELGNSVGFECVGKAVRPISRNRRLMPIGHKTTRQGIEARMHEEYVIAFLKPA